jgi:cell division septum initiation protein DivIVA
MRGVPEKKKTAKRQSPELLRLKQEVEELRARLAEGEETLEAIRSGTVDAVAMEGPEGMQVYTLKGAEQSYRVFLETMNEGAITLE